MANKSLEQAVSEAAQAFALEVVEAVKGASLQELMALQGAPKRLGRKPGPKPGTKRKKKPGPKPGAKRGPGRPKKKVAVKKVATKKRIVKNYPKCAYPGCGKNRFPRGKGFCGDHWRQWKDGKIKAASAYAKSPAKKVAKKKPAKKKVSAKKK